MNKPLAYHRAAWTFWWTAAIWLAVVLIAMPKAVRGDSYCLDAVFICGSLSLAYCAAAYITHRMAVRKGWKRGRSA